MVEIHLVWLESFSAVHAGHPPQLTQELYGRALSLKHTINLFLPVSAVVGHVVEALITRARHRPKMRIDIEACQ